MSPRYDNTSDCEKQKPFKYRATIVIHLIWFNIDILYTVKMTETDDVWILHDEIDTDVCVDVDFNYDIHKLTPMCVWMSILVMLFTY